MLVHHRDARSARPRCGSWITTGRAVDEDLARVGRHQPEQHVHERRLARAVLTEHAVDLAPHHRQVDVVAGGDRAEALGDAIARSIAGLLANVPTAIGT